MGDVRVLKDQIELGVPLESAAILAGYEFEQIEVLEKDGQIQRMIAIANAEAISRHLANVSAHSDMNPRMSLWLLERRFPEHFSPTNKIISKDEIPKSVILRGVSPSDSDE